MGHRHRPRQVGRNRRRDARSARASHGGECPLTIYGNGSSADSSRRNGSSSNSSSRGASRSFRLDGFVRAPNGGSTNTVNDNRCRDAYFRRNSCATSTSTRRRDPFFHSRHFIEPDRPSPRYRPCETGRGSRSGWDGSERAGSGERARGRRDGVDDGCGTGRERRGEESCTGGPGGSAAVEGGSCFVGLEYASLVVSSVRDCANTGSVLGRFVRSLEARGRGQNLL